MMFHCQSSYIIKMEWNNHLPVTGKGLTLSGERQYDLLLTVISLLSCSFLHVWYETGNFCVLSIVCQNYIY